MSVLTKEFISDPQKFLVKYAVQIPYRVNGAPNPLCAPDYAGDMKTRPGVYNFRFDRNATTNAVELSLAANSDPTVKTKVKSSSVLPAGFEITPIKAYWLPWTSSSRVGRGVETVTFATLNQSGADFLFTSALGGCRILITPESFSHIAGDTTQTWRAEKSAAVSPGQRKRAFSSTTGNSYGDDGFLCGKKTGMLWKSWKFYAQAVRCDGETGIFSVGQTFSNNQLYDLPDGQ